MLLALYFYAVIGILVPIIMYFLINYLHAEEMRIKCRQQEEVIRLASRTNKFISPADLWLDMQKEKIKQRTSYTDKNYMFYYDDRC